MEVALMVAVARNGVIGRAGGLPWNVPGELAYFQAMTWDKHVVMGRRTFESLPQRLRRRHVVVMTRQKEVSVPGVDVVNSMAAAWSTLSGAENVVVAGGAEVYAQWLPYVNRLWVTHLDVDVEGDVHLPELVWSDWHCVRTVVGSDSPPWPHRFCQYVRASA